MTYNCKACGRRVRIPKGWTRGPAVRRHYWAKHPEKMNRKRIDAAMEETTGPQRGR